MMPPASSDDDLRRRLFAELARGEEAELGEILCSLGVVAEPSADVDARVLSEAPGAAQEPPARVDRAVLAAAESALRERAPVAVGRRRRSRRAVVAAFALAAGLLLTIGLVRILRHEQPQAARAVADEQVMAAVLELTRDVLDRHGPEAAARVLAVADPGREGLRPPSWADFAGKGRRLGSDPLAPGTSAVRSDIPRPDTLPAAEGDGFARGLLAFVERARAGADEVAPEIEAMLVRERSRCPGRSRCHALVSLRLAKLALEAGRRDEARSYAAQATSTDDAELRARAEKLAAEASESR